ncbi:MAG: RnfABCDGE type electron transport complex subunit B [Candidatus Omnitrophica bacterium]|nr:RnfABCDGE type electron transport complex subunit B [Candidatus Omnitrophota bacterium]
MKGIILAVVSLSGLSFAFGLLLAWVSKKFHVEVDSQVARVSDCLPGVNCGACGLAGCASLAEALVAKKADINSCTVCNAENKGKIAEILGLSAEHLKENKAPVAVVACGGGKGAKDKFEYRGFPDCRVAHKSLAGHKQCLFACLGLGTCVEACAFGAIVMGEDDIPVVKPELCVGCRKCVEACPRDIIYMLDRKKKVYIKCRSHDMGPQVMKVCKIGCIGCMKCVKICPVKVIKMDNNLAVIDHAKCINCEKCVKACPTKAIAVV